MSELNLIERTLSNIEERRQKIINGDINCIPSPFDCFSNDFVGIQQGKYYVVSAHQKCGKTQLTSFLFLFNPILYAYNHPEQLTLKIFYYPLEETKERITLRFMSYLVYTMSGFKIQVSPEELSLYFNSCIQKSILEKEDSFVISYVKIATCASL